MHFRRRIPSLTALVTLEAVLRKKSFTTAATELGVTQAAVSRQIALLEEEFGQPLFVRKHRAIEPTTAWRLRQSDTRSQIGDRQPSVLGECGEDFFIELVQFTKDVSFCGHLNSR